MLTVYKDSGRRVEREELPSVVTTPRGKRSNRWKGIAHGELVDTMGRVITDKLGYSIKSTELVLSGGPTDRQSCLVGGFELVDAGYQGLNQDVSKCVAFCHDNAGTRSLGIYTGGTVAICANGLVSAEDRSRRKHTTGLELYPYLCERLSSIPAMFKATQERLDQLTSRTILPYQHEKLIVNLARKNVMSWSSIGKLDKAWNDAAKGVDVCWEKPDRKGDWPFTGSAWDWFNAATHVLKTQSPFNQVAKIQRIEHGLHSFVTSA